MKNSHQITIDEKILSWNREKKSEITPRVYTYSTSAFSSSQDKSYKTSKPTSNLTFHLAWRVFMRSETCVLLTAQTVPDVSKGLSQLLFGWDSCCFSLRQPFNERSLNRRLELFEREWNSTAWVKSYCCSSPVRQEIQRKSASRQPCFSHETPWRAFEVK